MRTVLNSLNCPRKTVERPLDTCAFCARFVKLFLQRLDCFFILFLIFDIEKTGNEENQYVTKDKAREIAEEVCKEILNTKENKYDK